MAKSIKVKSQAKAFACQSKEQASEAIAVIGEANREITMLETEINEITAKAIDERKDRINELKDVIKQNTQGVQTWCEANRNELCKNGKKANLVTGEVNWRIRPPKVMLRGIDDILKALKKAKLKELIRTKEEVNKDAILANPKLVKGIKGISIQTGVEDFVITPFEVEVG